MIQFEQLSYKLKGINEEIIKHLPKDIILMSQSELHIPFEIGGVSGMVRDYSMSIIGPGERAISEWKLAAEYGLETAAKVQINTTWESSTVPALPVAPSVERHIKGIRDNGVRHVLLSWTLGGYPSKNIAAAAKYFYDECNIEGDTRNDADHRCAQRNDRVYRVSVKQATDNIRHNTYSATHGRTETDARQYDGQIFKTDAENI